MPKTGCLSGRRRDQFRCPTRRSCLDAIARFTPISTSRLILLGILLLGSLYCLHLLAQDYQKIRRPVQTAAKVAAKALGLDFLAGRRRRAVDEPPAIDWETLLRHDPLLCASSLVCQLAAGAAVDFDEGVAIKNFILANANDSAPEKVKKARDLGRRASGAKECFQKFNFCPYSAKTMLRIVHLQTTLLS
ncbi:uncharacterized protein LOC132262399 [Phlebotomus argentipes]|uniref:uncharacterized protein LOC132262399 n=1 Tax=Phlebotomus argentipes TaxID=94469 RepID=UPI0028931DCB|nr:uncharacterized protein LOC132262399 [Phlebotomus argentipes]